METAETKLIRVAMNGESRSVPEGFSVARLLEWLEVDPAKVAVELNRSIVRRQDWSGAAVEDGAQIEIVWFVGGG